MLAGSRDKIEFPRMNNNFLPSRGVSLENIVEETFNEEEIEAPMSSRISSTTSYSRTLGSPRSLRRFRRQNTNPSFISARINSFDGSEDLSPLGATVDEWEYSRADINMPPNFTMTDVDLSPTGLEKSMRDLLTNSRYWINMVERLGYDKKVFDSETTPTLDQLSRYYDSSDLGLLRVFHLFDSDKDRLMSKEEMIRGLGQHGMCTNPDEEICKQACDELFDLCSDNGEEVSPLEFLLALRTLRLAAILHPFSLLSETRRNIVASREMDIHFHSYREDHMGSHKPLADPIDFLFRVQEVPETRDRVQWIHCHEASKRAVLALSVQFGLDPRYVLDVFMLWREQAKADRVRDLHSLIPHLHREDIDSTEWVFLVVPVIRLTPDSKAQIDKHFEWKRKQKICRDKSVAVPPVNIEVETCNMAIFVTGERGRGTVLTFTSEWCGLCKLNVEDVGSVGERTRRGRAESDAGREDTLAELKKFSTRHSNLPVTDSDLDMFPKVLKLLDTSYSHLRTGDAFTLVLKIVSDCCEDYVRIIDAYDAAIEVMTRKLRIKRDSLRQTDVWHIQRSSRHLSQLYSLVRPMVGVIDILAQQTAWGGESALYVSDLKSNVSKCMNDSQALSESCEVMRKQFRQMGKAKVGSVLYLLTLVTAVFEPITFVATLFGMNFKQPDDPTKPGIPELGWKYGYLFFWCIVLVMVSIVFTYYRKKSWI